MRLFIGWTKKQARCESTRGGPHRRRKTGPLSNWLRALTVSLLGVSPLLAQTPSSQPTVPASSASDTDALCTTNTNAQVVQSAGTRRMVERLKAIVEDAEKRPGSNPFLSVELAEAYRGRLSRATNRVEFFNLLPNYAVQLLYSGKSEEALRNFDSFREQAQQVGMRFDSRQESQLGMFRGVSALRIGEQENCLVNHTSESCIVPIREGGVHKLEKGSRMAISILSEHLSRFPNDLRARWVINIAYMTLGEYPDKVPPTWLIPPAAFASDGDIGRFPDIAGSVGLDVDDLAGGSIVDDFDGDGHLDIMASSWSLRGQLRFFRNQGDGTFVERTAAAGLTGLFSGLNMVQTDYNNDGLPDVFVLRGAWLGAAGLHPNSLLRNEGNGTFSDVTEEAGLLSFHPTQTATWFDFNGDGYLDVFIGNESWGEDIHPCELYRNNGNGTFTECAREAGVGVTQFIKGVTSGDYNNDGRPDLYLSSRDGPNILFRNDGPTESGGSAGGPWKFTNTTLQAGVADPLRSFPTWFWDYDNDGWLDLFVTGYMIRDVGDIAADYLGMPSKGEKARLYRNNRDGTFSDVTVSSGLYKVLHAMGANFGDLDNDGWLDFYLGTGDPDLSTLIPNRMFRNDGGKRFQDITTSGGFGHIQKGHGVSFADLDNDGDQDVYTVIGGAYTADNYRNALFLNPGHGNHWLTLKLEGTKANRVAIGARIRVVVNTPKGERTIHRVVTSGGSFGASPLRQAIGLGDATSIRSVEVEWPGSGKTQTFKDLQLDTFYRIQEGNAAAARWELKRFALPAGGGTPHVHERHAGLTK